MSKETGLIGVLVLIIILSAISIWAYAPHLIGGISIGYVKDGKFVPLDQSNEVFKVAPRDQ